MQLARLLLLSSVALVGVPEAHAQQLVLKPAAVVRGANYTWGDWVDLVGFDGATAARVGGLTLGPSPRVGQGAQLHRAELVRRVQALTGQTSFDWAGADTVTLDRASATVSGLDITDRAALYLRDVLQSGGGQRVSVQPVEELPDIAVARGAIELRVRPMPYSESLRSRAKMWVDVFVDGSFHRAVPVLFLVQVWRDAWVARDNVAAGQVVGCDAFVRTVVNLAEHPAKGAQAMVANDEACPVAHGRTRVALRRGELLTRDGIVPAEQVLAGDRVVLKAVGRGVTVEVTAELVQATERKARVRYGGRTFNATLSEDRQARLDEGDV